MEEVVFIKVFDKKKRDFVFGGKISTEVVPDELVKLRCFQDRYLSGILDKADMRVESFKGLQNNVELFAEESFHKEFFGVLFSSAEDCVLRKSRIVPSCECVMMSLWRAPHEECEKAFKCETLEQLDFNWCELRRIPSCIRHMNKLMRLRLRGLSELKSVPEEIGELSGLEELQIQMSGIENLPKTVKKLKILKSIRLDNLHNLQLHAEHLVVFSKLKRLTILDCDKVFNFSFAQSFWEMIKSTTYLTFLGLDWTMQNRELVFAALEDNGSIVDGGWGSEFYSQFFTRNKENHEKTMECVLHVLAIRRWRDVLNGVPKEMVRMIAMMLWNTRCDVKAWTK